MGTNRVRHDVERIPMTRQTVHVSTRTAFTRPLRSPPLRGVRQAQKPFTRQFRVRNSENDGEAVLEAESGIDVKGGVDGADATLSGPRSDKRAEQAAKKIATTFAPRPSGKVKNPATPGTVLYDLFGYQAILGAVAGGLLSFNILFPSDHPNIAKLLGMWSIWMFTVPSLRARECTADEKSVLNILFLLLPLINVALPFVWKNFPFVFTADVAVCGMVYYWKFAGKIE